MIDHVRFALLTCASRGCRSHVEYGMKINKMRPTTLKVLIPQIFGAARLEKHSAGLRAKSTRYMRSHLTISQRRDATTPFRSIL